MRVPKSVHETTCSVPTTPTTMPALDTSGPGGPWDAIAGTVAQEQAKPSGGGAWCLTLTLKVEEERSGVTRRTETGKEVTKWRRRRGMEDPDRE